MTPAREVSGVEYRQYAILYVDDEASNLASFRFCFEDQFQVLTASSGAEALEVLSTVQVAVLLTDVRMPGMGGAELCARVRERHPEVVRMVVTAYADIGAAAAAINAGQVSRYVSKPWREDELAATLRGGIDAYRVTSLVSTLQARLLQSEHQAGATAMMGSVLHELSSPAAALLADLTTMADDAAALEAKLKVGGAAADTARLASDVQRSAQGALAGARTLMGRIQRYRRADTSPAGIGEPHTVLAEAVESAAAVVRGALRQRARLELDLEPVPPVKLDETMVGQVLINLLVNASEAIEPGKPEQNRITVRVRRADSAGFAAVEVADTGRGMAADLLERVFEPFFSTKGDEAHDGRGIGLAIVQDVVRGAGGRVTARSELGRGTTFRVELPTAG